MWCLIWYGSAQGRSKQVNWTKNLASKYSETLELITNLEFDSIRYEKFDRIKSKFFTIRFAQIELHHSDPMDFKQKRLVTQFQFGRIESQKFENIIPKNIKKSKSFRSNFFRIFVSFRFNSIRLSFELFELFALSFQSE